MFDLMKSSQSLLALRKIFILLLQLTLTCAFSFLHNAEEAEQRHSQMMNSTLHKNSNSNHQQVDYNLTNHHHENLSNGTLMANDDNWDLPAATVVSNVTKDDNASPQSWKATHRASSYAFIITMLSITVVMATIFTLFGLFMKAEAHSDEHHDHHGADRGTGVFHGGMMGHDGDGGGFMKGISTDIE